MTSPQGLHKDNEMKIDKLADMEDRLKDSSIHLAELSEVSNWKTGKKSFFFF